MAASTENDDTLVGRQAELDLIDAMLTDLSAGRGACLLLEGEPGIGKTALLEAVAEGARSGGVRVLSAVCDELAGKLPLSVLFNALGLDPAGPAATSAPTGWPSEPRWDQSLAVAVERVLARVDQLCTEGPVLIAVDDLHWGDETTVLVWQRLCRMTRHLPLVLVAACRSEPRRDVGVRLRQAVRSQRGTVLTLDGLSPEEVRELAVRVLGAEPTRELAGRLESAAGNPLFVRELLDALMRSGAVTAVGALAGAGQAWGPGGGAGQARGPGARRDGSEPDAAVSSLLGVIEDRVSALSAQTGAVLRAAALLGSSFTVTDLSAVLDRSAAELAEAVQEALRANVLETAGLRLRYRHGLLRQALYESVPPTMRSALHRDAARALTAHGAPVERVAEVVLGALDVADGWEVDWIAENAHRLRGTGIQVEVELLEHAVARADSAGEVQIRLLTQLAEVYRRLSRFSECHAVCQRVLAVSSDIEQRLLVTSIDISALMFGGQPEAAQAAIACALAEPGISELWRVRLTVNQVMLLLIQDRWKDAAELAARCVAEGQRLADPIAVAVARQAEIVVQSMTGSLAGRVEAMTAALRNLHARPELQPLRIRAATSLALALTATDRFEQAAAVIAQIAPIAQQSGPPYAVYHLLAAGELAFVSGSWDDALAELEAAGQWMGGDFAEGLAVLKHRSLAALIAAHRGETKRAQACLRALPDELAEPSFIRRNSAYALAARAALFEAAGEPERALAALSAVVEPGYEELEEKIRLLPALVRLAVYQDRADLVSAAVAAAGEVAEEMDVERAEAAARWCKGLQAHDADQVAAAAGYYRRVGRRLELGMALEDAAGIRAAGIGAAGLGAAGFRAAGIRAAGIGAAGTGTAGAGGAEAARAELAEALEIYTDLGARWDALRATERWRGLGLAGRVRRVRGPATGWESLTPTERRIAQLVAAGESNPEIAAGLQVSRRTVETHVSRILAKLQARSRRDVAERIAGEAGQPG